MKYIRGIFIISCLFCCRTVVPSYRAELAFEQWAEMSTLNIAYKKALADLKEGKAVDCDSIFSQMTSLAAQLPIRNGAQAQYLALIQDREKEVSILEATYRNKNNL
ncbi:hypothetical protein HYV10_01200 [Candidatus Dependentiae bacterium]|nr:hypothetical protein [Candidatus Dependentiae bacterium]